MSAMMSRSSPAALILCLWLWIAPLFSLAQQQNQLTDQSFRVALQAFNSNEDSATTLYGPIEAWDVPGVKDFSVSYMAV